MGRAGGGSSGGSFGGGSFGGGHSFGGSRAGGHTFGGSSRAGSGSHRSTSSSFSSSSSSHRSTSSGLGGFNSSSSSHHSSLMDEVARGAAREVGRQIIRNSTSSRPNYNNYNSNYSGMSGFGSSYSSPTYESDNDGGLVGAIVNLVIFVIIAVAAFCVFGGGSDSSIKSTIQREKLTGTSYNANSVVIGDELGYIDSASKLGKELKEFYTDTGVQPYIYIKDYDPSLTSNTAKTNWAQQFYDSQIADTNGFMFIYFGSADDANNSILDSQKEIGYMSYVVGGAAGSVMDNEACEIFWSYIDRYWTSDMPTEDMFGTVFSKTANSIMKVDKTDKQTGMTMVIVLAGLGIGIVAVVLISKKFKRDKEKAAETERILNSNIDTLANEADSASNDDTVNKYL